MTKIKMLLATLMLFCGLVIASPMARAATVAPASPAPIAAVNETTAQVQDEEVAELEQREQQAAEQLEDFEGGDAIVITGSALAIALLIVLIIVAVD